MTHTKPLAVVILAAGKGTRMKSQQPKVMHPLMGLPMINWLLQSVATLQPQKTIVVIGPNMDQLAQAVSPHRTVIQTEQNGTGGALKAAMPALKDFDGDIVVLLGDTPLLCAHTMTHLIETRHHHNAAISVLGMTIDNPTGYGRLLMTENHTLNAIREEKDATSDEKKVNIVNTGAFCLHGKHVGAWLAKIDNHNASSEFYITDLPEIAAKDGHNTCVAITNTPDETMGCNTRLDLMRLEQLAQTKMREDMILNGVIMQDPNTVYLHHDTKIAAGTMIEPNVYFGAGVTIAEQCHIRAFSYLEQTHIGKNSVIGPFARLRPGATIGEDVRIGNFVEIKQSDIGNRSKIGHLAYVGDCTMGDDVNFSCGAVTVNYDGFEKHRTTIGKGVMVGSNVNLVAPVTIEDGAFLAAGSTISTNVPADALSVERAKAKVHEGWALRYRERKTL